MTAPTEDERRVPPYVALVRIAAVIGMSATIAMGIFLLIAGTDYWLWGLVSLALSLPFFGVRRRAAGVGEPPESTSSARNGDNPEAAAMHRGRSALFEVWTTALRSRSM